VWCILDVEWVPVILAWYVLRLQMEGMASRCGRYTACILNKQSWKDDKSCSWEIGKGANMFTKYYTGTNSLEQPKQQTMDMRFGTYNGGSLHGSGRFTEMSCRRIGEV
jgi:hypothetical protein